MSRLTASEQLALSDYMFSLYDVATSMSVQSFRHYAVNNLKNIVNFDFCCWMSMRENSAQRPTNEAYVHPVDSLYLPIPFKQFSSKLQNSPHSTNDDNSGSIYKKSHVLSTYINEQQHKCMHELYFYRMGNKSTFSDKEREKVHLVAVHIAEAMEINLVSSLAQYKSTIGNSFAIADMRGAIIQELGGSISSLYGKAIPKHFVNKPDLQYNLIKLPCGSVLKLEYQGQFIYITFIKRRNVWSLLSYKQHLVCEHLIRGKSNKHIAIDLKLSSYTVSNHLKKVFTLLEVSGRFEAIKVLTSEGIH